MKSLEKAIDAALDQMDDDALIKPFLLKNKAEVKIMCLTEYDEARTLAEERADGYEDGFENGLEKGRKEGINEGISRKGYEVARSMIGDGMADDLILRYSGISKNELSQIRAELTNP